MTVRNLVAGQTKTKTCLLLINRYHASVKKEKFISAFERQNRSNWLRKMFSLSTKGTSVSSRACLSTTSLEQDNKTSRQTHISLVAVGDCRGAARCRARGHALQLIDFYSSLFTIHGRSKMIIIITRGQSNLTKCASRGAHSPVRGHPRGSKFVPLNSWGRGSY